MLLFIMKFVFKWSYLKYQKMCSAIFKIINVFNIYKKYDELKLEKYINNFTLCIILKDIMIFYIVSKNFLLWKKDLIHLLSYFHRKTYIQLFDMFFTETEMFLYNRSLVLYIFIEVTISRTLILYTFRRKIGMFFKKFSMLYMHLLEPHKFSFRKSVQLMKYFYLILYSRMRNDSNETKNNEINSRLLCKCAYDCAKIK